MSQDFNQAAGFIAALTGNAESVMNFRAISDIDKTVPAIKRRGTLRQHWAELCQWNAARYGVFVTISAMDDAGNKLPNVQAIRAHFIDLDTIMAGENLHRAAAFAPAAAFAVQSSPHKYHVYWPVKPYLDLDGFQNRQRKLVQLFQSDPKVIDATRVMRMPGFYHCKGEAYLTQWFGLPGYGQTTTAEILDIATFHVEIVAGAHGTRKPLGDAELAAPSLEWLQYALHQHNPNDLARDEWISLTAAFKQAGWNLASEADLRQIWESWCAQYASNDTGENLKQWNDLVETQLGWKSIVNRTPSVKAWLQFHGKTFEGKGAPAPAPATPQPQPQPGAPQPQPQPGAPQPQPQPGPTSEILTPEEQAQYFGGCFLINDLGKILTPRKTLRDATRFNAEYGGRLFIIGSDGKTTDEPFKAATRGRLYTVPKVDKMRFLPHVAPNEVVTDELGRTGVNVYTPARIKRMSGDATPFLRHLQMMVPDQIDREIILRYLAHNAQRPGVKIPWSILLQSAEGAGKGIIKKVAGYIVGAAYVYEPKAEQLPANGSKFNAWMRNRLMIIVDEIRTDEKRTLVEILKPLISECRIEVEGKGQDQDLEDNYANWFFFSNYKDAIPVTMNSRRYTIIYSALQSVTDILNAGMNDEYFSALNDWLDGDGCAIVYDYLLQYKTGKLPRRAPVTSSWNEAVKQSLGAVERAISDAIADNMPGFRGGWVSTTAVSQRLKSKGMRSVSEQTIERILEQFGYVQIGRCHRPYITEEPETRGNLFNRNANALIGWYGTAQGYTD